jgi:hypothetical protein
MLLFRSKEHAARWSKQRQMPIGETLPYEQVWELSKLWYHDRLSPGFAGRSFAEAHRIFETVGLSSSFWRFE